MTSSDVKRFSILRLAVVACAVAAVGGGLVLGIAALSSSGKAGSETGANTADPVYTDADFMGMKPSDAPARSAWNWTPAPENTSAVAVDTALETYAASLLFLAMNVSESQHLDWDPVALPNGHYCKGTFSWQDVLDADGRSVIAHSSRNRHSSLPESGFGSSLKIALRDGQAKPYRAEGRLDIQVPVRWVHVSLPADRVGATGRDGPLEARLTACYNDCYAAEITGLEEGVEPVVFAIDAVGRRLQWQQRKRRGRKIAAQVKGRIETVEVYVPLQWHRTSAAVQAMGSPDSLATRDQIVQHVDNPRYLPDQPRPVPVEMTREELLEQTQVVAGRCDALWEYNQPEIRVYLPPVDNSAYAWVGILGIDNREPILLDAQGRSVQCDVSRSSYGRRQPGFGGEVRFEALQGQEDPVAFARARGRVKIRYPARIRRVTLSADRLESGALKARLSGTRVRVEGWNIPDASHGDDFHAAAAYDGSGRRLAPLSSGSFLGGMSDFWGIVREVEVLDVVEWIEVEIPFDLPPAPLLEKPDSILGL